MTRKTIARNAGRQHYVNVGYRESPLSGEWAGESIPELSHAYGIDLSDEYNADEFISGFWEAFVGHSTD